mmetsp:Transcript_7098/g.7982  ORF Transcript_7098/g.7982 Transcript_7098/m.7982 type:complete len:89 (-) Transcript_7098:165-431(-)|eukprot:CAMPEP_0205821758 /NCGR_PEP_ID=MMETSP0206-20130828/9439_1 /ASSEMBLY_ACC=CAM_ASM_000279 /TAXON_ID=36767 /ORGANISM="Euplotes focardii, Strain TN1" /LENGTH=88 /DNA_ID=CAMNT_0053117481 /DNA_START=32 /DNA_END=298 /DNA_ORIENTATION=+
MADAATFQDVADKVKTVPKGSISQEEALVLYGLYKQALKGDNTDAAPWAVQLEAKAKWTAWTAHKGKSQEQARQEYVALANGYIAKFC